MAGAIVACGGRAWDGVVEADELARLLLADGVPRDKIQRERASHDTVGNAREAAKILAGKRVVLVTCSWHLRRARLLFERAGVEVVRTIGADPPSPRILTQLWWYGRERVATWRDLRR